MRSILFTLFLLFLSIGCNKDALDLGLDEGDYLIFGNYYGFCGQNCTILYKLTNEDLFSDDIDIGLPQDIPFQKDAMPKDKFEIAKQLAEQFPKALLEEPKDIIGCPDCADQGGYYIEIKTGDITDHWRVDTFDGGLPQYLVNYTDLITSVLNQLQ